jgi:hypothetical protein
MLQDSAPLPVSCDPRSGSGLPPNHDVPMTEAGRYTLTSEPCAERMIRDVALMRATTRRVRRMCRQRTHAAHSSSHHSPSSVRRRGRRITRTLVVGHPAPSADQLNSRTREGGCRAVLGVDSRSATPSTVAHANYNTSPSRSSASKVGTNRAHNARPKTASRKRDTGAHCKKRKARWLSAV